MLDRKALLALIEKNPDAEIIYVDELPRTDPNDPDLLRRLEEIKKMLRPECFPPELRHHAIQPDEEPPSKD